MGWRNKIYIVHALILKGNHLLGKLLHGVLTPCLTAAAYLPVLAKTAAQTAAAEKDGARPVFARYARLLPIMGSDAGHSDFIIHSAAAKLPM
jgi:hypothetical protein